MVGSETGCVVSLAMGNIPEEGFMKDVIFLAVTLAFFAIAIAYVRFCDRIR